MYIVCFVEEKKSCYNVNHEKWPSQEKKRKVLWFFFEIHISQCVVSKELLFVIFA